MPQQWKLPGSSSTYLIVWSLDNAAKDRKRRVPASIVCEALAGWMRTHRSILQSIYEALEGAADSSPSGKKTALSDDQIKASLSLAFLQGRLVALKIEKDQDKVGARSDNAEMVPFRVLLPKSKKVNSKEFLTLACMQAFGLKKAQEVKALGVKLEGFEGRPYPEEIRQGYVDILFDPDIYRKGILSKFGGDPQKAKTEIAVQRKKYQWRSPEEQKAFLQKVDREFEKRTGHKPSKTKKESEAKVWESTQDDLLREEAKAESTTSQPGKSAHGVGPSWSGKPGVEDALLHLGIVVWDKTPPLQLRSSPATAENNVIGSLAFNTSVQILERLPGGWLHVSTLEQGSGYVAASYIWSAPEHPLFEPGIRLHRVEKYDRRTGKGTAIAIAQAHYSVRFGQGLPFYVALLAVVNGVPIPQTVEGWMELEFQAGHFIWLPSQAFADGMRGRINSGSYTYELLDALGLADLVAKIKDALDRIAEVLKDLAKAIWLSFKYIPEAIWRHVTEALFTILESLLVMAVVAILFLAACTAIGAWFGGGPGGAAAGFKIGMIILDWVGLGFLVKWAVESVARIGSAFTVFLVSVWNARGNQGKVDQAARELAEAVGICAGVLIELLVMWAAVKGIPAALKALKGTRLARAFGESRLSSWLREAVLQYNKAKPEIKVKEQKAFNKTVIPESTIRFRTPAQTLRWIQASQLARDLEIPQSLRKTLLEAPDPREAIIRAWTSRLAQELGIPKSKAETLLRSGDPAAAIFEIKASNLARELGIKQSEAEALLRTTEAMLRKEMGKGKDIGRALRRALGDKADWQRFSSEMEAAFKNRLLKFRRRLDFSMDRGYAGQEGQILTSEAEPWLCMKRWFKNALDKMPQSIKLLEEARAEVEFDPKLRELVEVVKIHERGGDWILRDFDPRSIKLEHAMAEPMVQAIRARVIAELQARQAGGTLSRALGEILKKISREPPSNNIRWSEAKKKCVIIDML